MSYNLVDSTTGDLTRVAGGIVYADNPIGSIIPFGSSAIPSGYLLCNGQEVSRTAYSELFAAIGTAFGTGDGSTTFNLPDGREATFKGAGLTGLSNKHMDADGLAVGEFIDDRIQDHKHMLKAWGLTTGSSNGPDYTTDVNATATSNGYTLNVANESARVGVTTEVKAFGVNYIIKAKHVGIPVGFIDAVDEAVKGVYGDIIPSDANASNKLATIDKVVKDSGTSVETLYNNSTGAFLETDMNLTATRSGILKVSFNKKETGNTLNIYINDIHKYAYPNWWGENIYETAYVPVNNGDNIRISSDVFEGGNRYRIVNVLII